MASDRDRQTKHMAFFSSTKPLASNEDMTSAFRQCTHMVGKVLELGKDLNEKMDVLVEKMNQIELTTYSIFCIDDPLKLIAEKKPWESSPFTLCGYQARFRVLMSGEGFTEGQSISVSLYLTPGLDNKPFPAKSITFAMFRSNEKVPHDPHQVTCAIRNNRANCPQFLPIADFLDDGRFLVHDHILLIGFAMGGEYCLPETPKCSLESRVQRLETRLNMSDPPIRHTCNQSWDPNDVMHCC